MFTSKEVAFITINDISFSIQKIGENTVLFTGFGCNLVKVNFMIDGIHEILIENGNGWSLVGNVWQSKYGGFNAIGEFTGFNAETLGEATLLLVFAE